MDNNDSHNPTTTQARLLHIRKNILKLSRSEVFKKYNIPVDTLASWELGRNNVSEKVLEQIIQIYNAEGILVDKEWLRTGNGLHPQLLFDLNRYFKKRPIVFEDNTPSDEILLIKEIEFFTSLTSNSIIALISTEDMLPIYSIGDYVGGRFRPKNQLDSCIGRDCIIKTLNGDLHVRRLIKSISEQPYTYNLACQNPLTNTPEPVMFNVEIECVAPIIWHRRFEK